jgi:predicted methyltransferase
MHNRGAPRTEEVDGIRMHRKMPRPHPYEFALYFDA